MPGKMWTFKLSISGKKTTGRLPARRGLSNKFALWKSNKWISRQNNIELAVRWYKNNIERGRALRREYNRRNPELHSVRMHFRCIFLGKGTYRGMPFFIKWNPRKGGSYRAAADWIIKNLGKRPQGSSLHIVNHRKGFVPGNLAWAYPKEQSSEQMFKIITRQEYLIKKLKNRLKIALDKLACLC